MPLSTLFAGIYIPHVIGFRSLNRIELEPNPAFHYLHTMANDTQKEIILALSQDWGLAVADTLSEEEIIRLLAERLVAYLDKGPDAFFQLIYRLDISERKLNAILGEQDPAPQIARLIYERQKEKARSRAFYKKDDKGTDDPELSW